MDRTYENIRRLAIIDARRRLKVINNKIKWTISDKAYDDGYIEKVFTYNTDEVLFTNLTLNEYALIREIKYIVWRFEVTRQELNLKKGG